MEKDCFALKHDQCTILDGQSCENCKFKKTQEQFDKDRQLSLVMIKKLGPYKFMEYKLLYYPGAKGENMLWNQKKEEGDKP